MADSRPPAVPPLPIFLIVSCSAAWVIAQLSYNALPQFLDPIKVAFDRSDEVVTRMYGYELFVFAIVALAAAGPLARFSRVLVALLGGAIAVAAGVVSALTDSYSVLVVCRIMLGAGGALAGAAGTAAAASSRDPEREDRQLKLGFRQRPITCDSVKPRVGPGGEALLVGSVKQLCDLDRRWQKSRL